VREKKGNKTEYCELAISGVGFLMFSFCILHTNMHHLIFAGKRRRASNIPDFGKTKTMVVLCSLLHCVLCFRSVCFFLSFLFSPLCLLTISPLSHFSYVLISCFTPPFFFSLHCSLSSLYLPLWCSSSSGFYSQRTPAILVSRRPSRWRGISAAIPAPLNREYFP